MKGFVVRFKLYLRGVVLKIRVGFFVFFNFGAFCEEFVNSIFEGSNFESSLRI